MKTLTFSVPTLADARSVATRAVDVVKSHPWTTGTAVAVAVAPGAAALAALAIGGFTVGRKIAREFHNR